MKVILKEGMRERKYLFVCVREGREGGGERDRVERREKREEEVEKEALLKF